MNAIDHDLNQIRGSKNGGSQIVGTAGADRIRAYGAGNTIYTDGGSDVVTPGALGQSIVYTADGDTTVRLRGNANLVTGSDRHGSAGKRAATGDVTVRGEGATDADRILLGRGNDRVALDGTDDVIRLGRGDDRVTGTQSNGSIRLGNGDNSAVLTGSGNTVISHRGSDRVSVAGDGNTLDLKGRDDVKLSGYGNSVVVANGESKVRSGGGAAQLVLGQGNDTVVLAGDDNRVQAGDGDDTIRGTFSNGTLALGGGDDRVRVVGSGNAIAAGDGRDVVIGTGDTNAITLGDGADTIRFQGANDSVRLGDGNDRVEMDGDASKVVLGNGDDLVRLNGNDTSLTVGSGHDIIQVSGLNDMLVLQGGVDQVTAGEGATIAINAATLALRGAGHDVVTLAGAGASSIDDLSGALRVATAQASGSLVLRDVARDPAFVLDLTSSNGGYATAADAAAALHDDGHGGMALQLGAGAAALQVDFADVSRKTLTAANFRIG